MPERNHATPNLPSLSCIDKCMDNIGQHDSLFFFFLEFFALLDTTNTGTVQSVDIVLRQEFFLRAYIREKQHSKCIICFGVGV